MHRLHKRVLFSFLIVLMLSVPLPSRTASATAPTEDLTDLQWAFAGENSIHVPGWNDPAGNMEEEIIVAVIDGGIDHTHPDLQGVVYEFSEEERQALRCGRYGYDAVAGDFAEPAGDYHATHVAGIIGGKWDGSGISGVCSNVKIISINCAVEDDTPLDYCLKAYEFIIRALDYGIPIRVINNSWGNVDSSLAMNELVEEAGRRGALSVFAAGNYADNLEDTVFIPASFAARSPYAVVVGSSDERGLRSYFSNYGETVVDIFAPGTGILSSIPVEYDGDVDFYYANDGYVYMNGTSMATPAVTGGAAYLAGNHPEVTDAASLKTLLLSCTTPLPGLEDVFANGMLDLSVDLRGDYAPVITALSAEGTQIVAEGVHFGTNEGTVEVLDASSASMDEDCAVSGVIWSDTRITLTLQAPPPAAVKVYVEQAPEGKHDAAVCFLSPSARVYPGTHTLPSGTGAPDVIDAMPDYQAAGFLGGKGGALYYLPFKFLVEDVIVGFEQLFRYDIADDAWEELSPLPERVVATQAAFWEDTLLVVGTDADRERSLAFLYRIDDDRWDTLDASQIPLLSTAVNCDGEIVLVGGAVLTDGLYRGQPYLMTYDIESGTCTADGALAQGVYGAQAVYGNGTLYVYGSDQVGEEAYLQYFQVVTDTDARLLPESSLFPAFRRGEGNRRPKFNVALHGELVLCLDGLYLVGPLSEDGQSDTYLLDTENGRFMPVALRLSDVPVIWPCACAYDGRLYAIARSVLEPEFQIFRSMDVATAEESSPYPAALSAVSDAFSRLILSVIRLSVSLSGSAR